METSPGPSVAASQEKTNAIPWKSMAQMAVLEGLKASGHIGPAVTWRDGHLSEGRWWASFDVFGTHDVVWAAQVDGSAPPGSLPVSTPWGDVGVWRHPHDPALPGLRVAAVRGGLRHLITAAAPEVDADAVDLVALQPLQRAVVRVGRPGQLVYVKVLPPWRLAVVAQRYRTAHEARLPTPAVLGVDSDLGVIVLQELPGITLAARLELGGPLPSSDDVWHVITRLAATLGTHGDLHDRQVLVDDAGSITGVVDLDEAGDGELVDDLGRLLAHVGMRGETHPDQRDRVATWVRDLRAVFRRHVDVDALRRRETETLTRLSALSRPGGSRTSSS